MRFLLLLILSLALGIAPLMAPPPDHSTPLRDMAGAYVSFCALNTGYSLDFSGRYGSFHLKRAFHARLEQSLACALAKEVDTLTIDSVCAKLQKYVSSQSSGSQSYSFEISISDFTVPFHLMSHVVEDVSFYGNAQSATGFDHMVQTMEIHELKQLRFYTDSFTEVRCFQDHVAYFLNSILRCPQEYKEFFLGKNPQKLPILAHAGDSVGWRDLWDECHSLWSLEHCLPVSYFAAGQNPLDLQNVHPWRAEILRYASQGTPSPENGEANGDMPVPAKPKPKTIKQVRPEIKDFGLWLKEVTKVVQVTQLGGYILCDSAYHALEASLKVRLKGIDQSAYEKELHGLVTALPTLGGHLNTTLKDAHASLAQPVDDSEVEPSPEPLPGLPVEMWWHILNFLKVQKDQVNSIMALPFLIKNLDFFLMKPGLTSSTLRNLVQQKTFAVFGEGQNYLQERWTTIFKLLTPQNQARALISFPFLRQNLGMFLQSTPELARLIPMMFVFQGAGVTLEIGKNYVDILDASTLDSYPVPIENSHPSWAIKKVREPLPKEGWIFVEGLTIYRLGTTPTVPREAAMQIDFKPCWRVNESPEEDKSMVVSATLTLLERLKTGDRVLGIFGPLYLEDPSTLPDNIAAHPDCIEATKIILSYLALRDCQNLAMANAGIASKR